MGEDQPMVEAVRLPAEYDRGTEAAARAWACAAEADRCASAEGTAAAWSVAAKAWALVAGLYPPRPVRYLG